MKQIKKILDRLKNAELKFRSPKRKNFLIFDSESFEDLKYITDTYDYYLLETRFQNITKIYLNLVLFFKILINYRGNLWTAYLISLIELVSPKIIITFSDNSLKFSEIAKRMEKKNIIFYAIQNGARYDLKRYLHKYEKGLLKEDMTKKIFIPNFFCFGKFEEDDYKSKKINVQNFIPVGSLRLANFILEKKIKLKNKNYIYDILLVSDGITEDVDKNFGTEGEVKNMAKFIKYSIKYATENKKKIIFSLKRLNSTKKNLDEELKFYKKNLNNFENNFFIKNSTIDFEKSKYLTYELMLKSNITMSAFSTLLRENLSIGRKSLSVNLMNNNIFNFPLEGLCNLKKCDYDEFQNKVNAILKMSEEEFTAQSNHENYLMYYNEKINTISNIKKQINKYLI